MASRRRALLIAGGCLPFAAGALLGEGGGGLPCPFRTATGLPCPLCGASRAFALAARGDAAFLDYNAVWVAAAVLAVLAGLAGRLRTANPVLAVTVLMLLGWAYALAQRGAIAG